MSRNTPPWIVHCTHPTRAPSRMTQYVAGGTTRGGRAPMRGVRKLVYVREIWEKTPGVIVIPGYQGVTTK